MIKYINEELCDGCGKCDLSCPMDVIYMNAETGKAEIRYQEDCMTCYNCELECPTEAIYVDPIKCEKPQPW
ncbi:MAG: ferredoxin family protein [Desulfobacteraceae bacterium]|nr:ferredoxin family protein [Desulfobacteraceae bacterium]